MHEAEPVEEAGEQAENALPKLRMSVLRTGTYMHTYCPACDADLIQGDWIVFNIKASGRSGELKLSPRYNVFDKESTIQFEPDVELDDIRCPRCDVSMINPRVLCGRCNSKTAQIKVSTVDVDIHLNVCTKLGCTWHGLSRADRARLILDE